MTEAKKIRKRMRNVKERKNEGMIGGGKQIRQGKEGREPRGQERRKPREEVKEARKEGSQARKSRKEVKEGRKPIG